MGGDREPVWSLEKFRVRHRPQLGRDERTAQEKQRKYDPGIFGVYVGVVIQYPGEPRLLSLLDIEGFADLADCLVDAILGCQDCAVIVPTIGVVFDGGS